MVYNYIYIDSSRRDRTEYPNPGDFKIPFGNTDYIRARDPIRDDSIENGTIQAGPTLTTIVLDPTTRSNSSSYYTNNDLYLRITSGPATGDWRRIISYTGTTAPAGTVRVSTFSALPIVGNNYEIHRVKDNYHPLIYMGNQKTYSVCYCVELLTLVLPNDIVITNSRNVFVQFSIESEKHSKLIMTNNPELNKATFVVPVDDTSAPFLYLKNCKMIVPLKFKPDDTIIFKVFLEDGSSLSFTDTSTPVLPDPSVQISATFAMTVRPDHNDM